MRAHCAARPRPTRAGAVAAAAVASSQARDLPAAIGAPHEVHIDAIDTKFTPAPVAAEPGTEIDAELGLRDHQRCNTDVGRRNVHAVQA